MRTRIRLVGDADELEDLRADATDLIPSCIFKIDAYWKAHRRPGATSELRGRKPGRNDPCPCGSGRKYKRCCGANLDRTGNLEAIRVLLGLNDVGSTARYLGDTEPQDALAISRAHEM